MSGYIESEREERARRIAENLIAVRRSRGLSQGEVSRRTGIARPNVARAEAGVIEPMLSTLARLAGVYGVTLSSLVAPADPVPPPPALGNAAKTHCPDGHEYTPGNLRSDPDGHRRCRECHKLDMRTYRASGKAR